MAKTTDLLWRCQPPFGSWLCGTKKGGASTSQRWASRLPRLLIWATGDLGAAGRGKGPGRTALLTQQLWRYAWSTSRGGLVGEAIGAGSVLFRTREYDSPPDMGHD